MRKRLVALEGVALSGPALLLGSALTGALTLPEREAPLTRPLAYVLEPLRAAYAGDRDGALLLYLGVQWLLLALVWGFFGGALARLAAVDLSGHGREPGRAALGYARRHLGALWGSGLLFVLSFAGPLGLAWLAARLTLLPGLAGSVATPLAVLLVVVLALAGVVGGTLCALCAFLSRPAVAVDGADLFDAVSRPCGWALAGVPRVVGVRLLFLAGALAGSGWRLLRTLLAGALAALLIEAAVGPERWSRITAVLGALGRPPDAARLGVTGGDVAAAAALALAAAGLLGLWLADLASRLACARTAAYLVLRRALDGVPVATLAAAPRAAVPETPEQAGFVEVSRVGEP